MFTIETIHQYLHPDLVNSKDINNNTPLHIACLTGDYEMIRRCLEIGADKNTANKEGRTSYQIVCESGKTLLLKLFHTYG